MASMDPKTKEYINELKKRFTAAGDGDELTDREMLTLLVAYTNCSDDPITVAGNMLEYFGSYRNCLLASYKELVNVDGVTENTAMLILLIAGIYGMQREAPAIGKKVTDIESLFINAVNRKRVEELYIAVFDGKDTLLNFEKIASGRPGSVWLEMGDVLDIVAYHKARKIVLGHTHPGTAVPRMSERDIETSYMIGCALSRFGIEYIGQVIVTDREAKLFEYTGDNIEY